MEITVDTNLNLDADVIVIFENELEEFSKSAHAKSDYVFVDNKFLHFKIDIRKMTKQEAKDFVREKGFKLIKLLKQYNITTAAIQICDSLERLKSLVYGLMLGDYVFDTFKTEKQTTKLEKLILLSEKNKEEIELIISDAKIITQSINYVRELVNTPPDIFTPLSFANEAQQITKGDSTLICNIGDEEFLKKERMNAYLSVSRASVNPPRFIHLSYQPKTKGKTKGGEQKIVFVGKGLTYDTGGLSLKPADYMTTMKADKSGGCAVLGIMKILSAINFPLEVHGIIGGAENAIGSKSYRPDDILISRSKKSVEVLNTDAEGRLVLADCLDYAQDLAPTYLIDLATLTGACVVALGEYSSGVMGFNKELVNKFVDCAVNSGELAAYLPFNRFLKELIESKNADIANASSSRYGGAITAGMFLGEFIREEYKDRWIHVDIAGPSFVKKEWDLNPYGASGVGVRMCIEFLRSLI